MKTLMNESKVVVKIDEPMNSIEFIFREKTDGEKFDQAKHVTFDSIDFSLSELPQSIKDYAVFHGIKQKLADSLAFTKEDKKSKTVDDAVDSLTSLWQQLKDGNWNAPTKAGRKSAPSVKLSDMESKFLEGVKTGVTTWEAANSLYSSMTGKQLPKLETTAEETTDNETELN